MMNTLFGKWLGLLPVLIFASCATSHNNGVGGRVQTQQTSSSLQAQGIRQFDQMKRTKKLSSNASYRAQVSRVGNRLRKVIPSGGRGWEFVVFEDKSPNAFALPGGKVGINSGIFQLTQNDAGLAAVLGHEMAHVIGAHAQSRVQRQKTIALGSAVLDSILASRGVGAGTRQATAMGGELVFGRPHSRSQELEADRVGTLYMARAGYDPREAIKFWRRFAAYNQRQGGQTPEFLRTHPLGATRIKALEDYLPTALQAYRR